MPDVIIFKNDNGIASVVWPTDEALSNRSIHDIARKDVPAGRPYKIVSASEIPTDRSQRAAWTVDDADLTDGIGGESHEFD